MAFVVPALSYGTSAVVPTVASGLVAVAVALRHKYGYEAYEVDVASWTAQTGIAALKTSPVIGPTLAQMDKMYRKFGVYLGTVVEEVLVEEELIEDFKESQNFITEKLSFPVVENDPKGHDELIALKETYARLSFQHELLQEQYFGTLVREMVPAFIAPTIAKLTPIEGAPWYQESRAQVVQGYLRTIGAEELKRQAINIFWPTEHLNTSGIDVAELEISKYMKPWKPSLKLIAYPLAISAVTHYTMPEWASQKVALYTAYVSLNLARVQYNHAYESARLMIEMVQIANRGAEIYMQMQRKFDIDRYDLRSSPVFTPPKIIYNYNGNNYARQPQPSPQPEPQANVPLSEPPQPPPNPELPIDIPVRSSHPDSRSYDDLFQEYMNNWAYNNQTNAWLHTNASSIFNGTNNTFVISRDDKPGFYTVDEKAPSEDIENWKKVCQDSDRHRLDTDTIIEEMMGDKPKCEKYLECNIKFPSPEEAFEMDLVGKCVDAISANMVIMDRNNAARKLLLETNVLDRLTECCSALISNGENTLRNDLALSCGIPWNRELETYKAPSIWQILWDPSVLPYDISKIRDNPIISVPVDQQVFLSDAQSRYFNHEVKLNEILMTVQPSIYTDEEGKPKCALSFFSAGKNIDKDNFDKRYNSFSGKYTFHEDTEKVKQEWGTKSNEKIQEYIKKYLGWMQTLVRYLYPRMPIDISAKLAPIIAHVVGACWRIQQEGTSLLEPSFMVISLVFIVVDTKVTGITVKVGRRIFSPFRWFMRLLRREPKSKAAPTSEVKEEKKEKEEKTPTPEAETDGLLARGMKWATRVMKGESELEGALRDEADAIVKVQDLKLNYKAQLNQRISDEEKDYIDQLLISNASITLENFHLALVNFPAPISYDGISAECFYVPLDPSMYVPFNIKHFYMKNKLLSFLLGAVFSYVYWSRPLTTDPKEYAIRKGVFQFFMLLGLFVPPSQSAFLFDQPQRVVYSFLVATMTNIPIAHNACKLIVLFYDFCIAHLPPKYVLRKENVPYVECRRQTWCLFCTWFTSRFT